jgi:hypothetical protein
VQQGPAVFYNRNFESLGSQTTLDPEKQETTVEKILAQLAGKKPKQTTTVTAESLTGEEKGPSVLKTFSDVLRPVTGFFESILPSSRKEGDTQQSSSPSWDAISVFVSNEEQRSNSDELYTSLFAPGSGSRPVALTFTGNAEPIDLIEEIANRLNVSATGNIETTSVGIPVGNVPFKPFAVGKGFVDEGASESPSILSTVRHGVRAIAESVASVFKNIGTKLASWFQR